MDLSNDEEGSINDENNNNSNFSYYDDDGGGVGNCTEFTDGEEELLAFIVFWIEGITLTALAVAGLVANVISIIILNKKDLRTFFSQLLIVLIVFDSLYLLLSIVEAFRRSFKLISHLHIYLFPYFLHPFHSLFMVASIYMTIAIAVERYRAVIDSIRLRQAVSMTKRQYRRRRLCKYVSIAVVVAVAVTIPRFFELKIVNWAEESSPANETSPSTNETASSSPPVAAEVELGIETTSLRTDPIYNLYYVNLTRFTLTGGGPMVLLAFFYYRIYHAVRGHNLQTRQLSATSLQADQCRRRQEAALSALFINIILVFIVCHLPRVLINIIEITVIDMAEECFERGMSAYGLWMHVAVCFNHLLLVANASINIIFYIWQNKAFKNHFLRMFRRNAMSTSTFTPADATTTRMMRASTRSCRKMTEDSIQIDRQEETRM